MDKNFETLSGHINGIVYDDRVGKRASAEELLQLWNKIHEQGIEPYDFAHALLVMSSSVMLSYGTLDEALRFGEFTREHGQSSIRAISQHWPPPDPEKWPDRIKNRPTE